MLAKRFELEPKSYVAFAVGSMCACTVMLPEPFVRKDKSELEAFVVIKLFLIDTVSITTDPVPFASKFRSPFVLVELTVFPSNFRLSTPKSPSTVNSYSGDDVFTPTLPVLSGNSTRLLLEVVDIVSPFMDMETFYNFKLSNPNDKLSVFIKQTDADETVLTATQTGDRKEFSFKQLAINFLKYQLMTIKIISSILYEALLLWKKGAIYRKRDVKIKNHLSFEEYK